MRKKLSVLLAAVTLYAALLTGCAKYSSHYNAVGFVHNNLSDEAFMDFYSFEGEMVFTLEKDDAASGKIKCSGKLESGSIDIYIDADGSRRKLFTLAAGEETEAVAEGLVNDEVYIIAETNCECRNGKLSFTAV